MSNLEAKLASAFIVTAAIGLGGLAAGLPDYVATAADGCLTEPNDATSQGQHWYYHLERGTGRKCWYLRGEGEQSARADAPAAVPSRKPAARRQDAGTTHSIADARAELGPRTRVADDATPSVWPNPPAAAAPAAAAPVDNNAATAPLASRWPQSAGAAPADSNTAPADQAPEATLMVADAQSDDAAQQQPGVPPPPVAAPPERQIGSIQKLFLVAGGALALAGLTGSAVYRLGRRRKRNDWLRERSNWQSEQNPHNPPWVEPVLAQPHTALADLDETHGAVPQSDFAAASDFAEAVAEADDTGEPVEKIEDFLARLTAQLHQELEITRSDRDVHASS
jgi:hypothetical protein